MVAAHLGDELGHRGAAQPVAATVRAHPHAVDLGDGAEERADIGLEQHLALLDHRIGAALPDQLPDPVAVGAAAVAEQRIDPDLLAEHRHRGREHGRRVLRLGGPQSGAGQRGHQRRRVREQQRLAPAVLAHLPVPGAAEGLPQPFDRGPLPHHRAGPARPARQVRPELVERARGRGQRREVHPVPEHALGQAVIAHQGELLGERGGAGGLPQPGTAERVGDRVPQGEVQRRVHGAGAHCAQAPAPPEHGLSPRRRRGRRRRARPRPSRRRCGSPRPAGSRRCPPPARS